MHGTVESHKQRVELESRVQALWKTFELHSKVQRYSHAPACLI